MNALVLNSVTDTRANPSLARQFDSLFDEFARLIDQAFREWTPGGSLRNLYVQYEFDCSSLPDAVKGIKVGRFARKSGSLVVKVEITGVEFANRLALERQRLLVERLKDAVSAAEAALRGKVDHDLSSLAALVGESSQAWLGMPMHEGRGSRVSDASAPDDADSAESTSILVLQFPDTAIDLSQLVALEGRLGDELPSGAEVDGHDTGAGESNLFIVTENPVEVFGLALEIVDPRLRTFMSAGYRSEGADEYTPLWPPGAAEFTVQ